MAKIRVEFDFSEKEISHLVALSIKYGFKRVDPTIKWRASERVEAVRFLAKKLVDVTFTE